MQVARTRKPSLCTTAHSEKYLMTAYVQERKPSRLKKIILQIILVVLTVPKKPYFSSNHKRFYLITLSNVMTDFNH